MTTATLDPVAARILSGYSSAAAPIRQRVIAYITTSFGGLTAYRDADIDTLVARIVPVVTGSQAQLAAMTDAYLAAVISANVGPTRPVGIPRGAVTDAAMRGVEARDVYARIGPTIWTALAGGAALEVAARAGLIRAQAMASTDLQLARTHSAQYVLSSNDRVVGYARVPGGECCDLCALASDETYHSGDLMPIHDRCSCDVEPIFETGGRPETNVDPERIDSLKAGGTGVVVQDHGELGPVLAVAGQSFTGADDL